MSEGQASGRQAGRGEGVGDTWPGGHRAQASAVLGRQGRLHPLAGCKGSLARGRLVTSEDARAHAPASAERCAEPRPVPVSSTRPQLARGSGLRRAPPPHSVRGPGRVFLLPMKPRGHFQMGLRGAGPPLLLVGDAGPGGGSMPTFTDHPASASLPSRCGQAVWAVHGFANTWNGPF